MKTTFRCTKLALLLSLSSTVFASPTPYYPAWFKPVPVITLSVGSATAKVGETQTETIEGGNQNTYEANQSHHTELLLGGFVGAEIDLNNWLAYQIGLNYTYMNAFPASGVLYQASNISMDFDNFSYSYSVKSQQLLLDTKWLVTWHEIFHPYVTVGAGMSTNKAYGYKEEPRYDYSGPPHDSFSDYTTHSFSYELGLGMDVDVTCHTRIGAGYRFADLGSYSLSSNNNTDTGLGKSHLYANEFAVQLTYLF